jgi:hypothetical protein
VDSWWLVIFGLSPIECFVVDFLGVVSVVNDCGLRIFLFWWVLGKPM